MKYSKIIDKLKMFLLTNLNIFGIILMFLEYIRLGNAGIAQLIERCLAKAEVAGLSPVSRSIYGDIAKWLRHESAKL